MTIEKLELTNFRNIAKLNLELRPGLNILVGQNAQGKTNLLEAIHYLTTTRSFRTSRDHDLIGFGTEFARLAGGEVEVVLQVSGKTLKLHGKEARAAEVLGAMRSVLFSPEDMSLLSGPPQDRRDFLDELISRIDRKYLLTLLSYHKTLKQRNRLLWQIRERASLAESRRSGGEKELESWDDLLIRDGVSILNRRMEVIGKLQTELDEITPSLFGGEKLILKYQTKLAGERPVAEAFYEQLKINRPREIGAATSLTGPHRDDWEVLLVTKNLGRFGSRGEERSAVLSLKLAEVNLDEAETGARPILLLDDVLSELDTEHQQRLLAEVGKQQTVLSATSLDFFPAEIRTKARVFQVTSGQVKIMDN